MGKNDFLTQTLTYLHLVGHLLLPKNEIIKMTNKTAPKLSINKAGNYEIRWTENRITRRISCQTKDKTEAERKLAVHILKSKKPELPSVRAILSTYQREHVDVKVVDKERQADCFAVLNAGLGELDVFDLTPDVMSKYCDARKAGEINGRKVGNSTLRRELNCLVAAINHAAKHRRIKSSDVPHIALPDAPPPKDLWLNEAQLETFVATAAKLYQGERMSRLYRFVVIAAETAARKTSILTLRWQQVDLSSRLINYQNDGKQRTKKRRVPVPMSDLLFDVLTRAHAERTQDEWVLDTPYSIQHHFEALVRTSGAGFEDVTPHTLRHTWATQAARAGVPLFEIAGVLGDNLATVMRVYAHHCPDHLRGAVNFRAARNASQEQSL